MKRVLQIVFLFSFLVCALIIPGPLAWAGPNEDLIDAAETGDVHGVEKALRAGADVNARDHYDDGATALMDAARGGHAAAVRLLLKAGADVNARDKDGWTALMAAADRGNADVVTLLLRAGADVNARDKVSRSTAEEFAKVNSRSETISILDDWKASHSGTAVASTESSASPSDNGSSSPPPSSASGLSQTEAQNIADQAAKQAAEQANAKTNQEIAELKQEIANQNNKPAPPKAPTFHSSVDRPTYRESEHRKDFALVVGVEKYQGGIPRAQFADRDARAVARHLRALGIPPDHMTVLSDDVATRGRIKEALAWLKRNVKSGSTVWVYFSGHGAPNRRGDAYLVPFGGDPSGLRYTALQVSTLYRTLNTLPAEHVIVALDACFTGEGKRSILGTVRPLVTTIRAGAVPRSGKLIVLTASRADQESGVLNTKGHGLFTYYLLKGLNGGAVRGGHVTVASLYRYVKPRVREKANLDNRSQTPELEPRNAESGASVRLR